MPYLYETHVHCSQCSACAVSTSRELVQAYHAAGFAGLVLTDHFVHGNTAVSRALPWEERMSCYYNAYLEAKAEGERLDFDVIFGIEHAYGDGKEMLIYGIELDFLLANPDIPWLSIDELAGRVHAIGGLVIQAHPYRDRFYIDMSVEPRCDIADGIEVCNAGNFPQENVQALALARKTGLLMTCGGDVHASVSPTLGAAGVALRQRVHDSREFAAALKGGGYGYVVGGRLLREIEESDLAGEEM